MIELSQALPAGAGYTVTSVWLSRGENPIISFCLFVSILPLHYHPLGLSPRLTCSAVVLASLAS